MSHAQCNEPRLKGMLAHVYQIIRDRQVHPWVKVRKWSNETLVKSATQEWDWSDAAKITQARNSQYMIQTMHDAEGVIPCPEYNKGNCICEVSHFGVMGTLAHVCAFCYALDGLKEPHQSCLCGKRRSSSNYFRHRDDNGAQNRKEKPKNKSWQRRRGQSSKKLLDSPSTKANIVSGGGDQSI